MWNKQNLNKTLKQPEIVLGLFQPHLHIYSHVEKYANKAETSLKLFQAVSVFCFRFISAECAMRFRLFALL